MASPRFLRSRQIVKARRTSGNLVLNNTSWSDVDTGLDLTLSEAQAGDEIVYGISGMWGDEVVLGQLDVVTVVSGSPVNSFCEQGAVVASPGVRGIIGWRGVSDTQSTVGGLSMPYTLVAGDIDSGGVTLRLRYSTSSATNKTLKADTDVPLDVFAINLGPLQS